jgi:hypothetical membrane protein
MRWLALGGIAGPALFASVVAICASMRPDYSHVAQFMSELGATGTPHAGLMNLVGFIPTGVLIGAFGLSLASALPRSHTSRLVGVLLCVFGLGLILAGIFPCAPGCPQETATLHDGLSVAAFVSAIAGIGLSAYRFRSVAVWRPLWCYSALSSGAALCLLVALASSLDSRSLTGLWQRLLVGTLFLWCAVAGGRAFRLGSRRVRAA